MRAEFFGKGACVGGSATAALLAWAVFASPLTQAWAADLDYSALRGAMMEDKPVRSSGWSGVYLGAQAGYANSNVDFGNAAGDLVAYALRDTIIEAEAAVSGWTALPEKNARHGVYGAFLGYNSQWDDVVLGVEVNYATANMSLSARDVLRRSYVTSNQYTYDVGLDSRSAVEIVDYMTFRARAGYVLGTFMPYASLGVAVGRASIDRSTSVASTAVDYSGAGRPTLRLDPNPTTISEKKNNEFAYGIAAGVGVDVLVTESIFLRGEYEYIRFVSLSKARADINALRGAVGVKF